MYNVNLAIRRFRALLDPDWAALKHVADVSLFFDQTGLSLDTIQAPPKVIQKCLQRLINIAESFYDEDSEELLDHLYTQLERHLCRVDADSCFAILSLTDSFEDGSAISVAVDPSVVNHLVVEGSTGFRVWEAAKFLGSYLLSNEGIQYIENKRVIELGAGTGFAGLCAARVAKHVTLTDCHDKVLDLLSSSAKSNVAHSNAQISVKQLDWTRDRFDEAFDVVIGADLVYDPRLLEPLVETLSSLQFDLAFICSAVRDLHKIDAFHKMLRKYNLFYDSVKLNWSEIVRNCLILGDEIVTDMELLKITRTSSFLLHH